MALSEEFEERTPYCYEIQRFTPIITTSQKFDTGSPGPDRKVIFVEATKA
jgi:hypothetical protein